MKGRLMDLTIGLTGKQRVTIEVDGDLRPDYEKLRETDVSVDLKKFRQKRSLDANAYCWTMLDKLAAVTGTGKTALYRNYIRAMWAVTARRSVWSIKPHRSCVKAGSITDLAG